MNGFNVTLSAELDALRTRSLIAGVVVLIVCLSGVLFAQGEFFRAYLIAYVFWTGVPLGCLGILMIHHLVGGTWGFVIQRCLEAAVRTFPIMLVLFVPLLFGLPDLFAWARPDVVAADPVLQEKAAYLNFPFFVVRAVIYFAIWIALGFFLTRWSQAQERSADPVFIERLQTLSGPGLVLYGLTVTFSAIDWLMSLEPRWYSTIFGMIFMVSHGVIALSFVIGAAYFLSRREALKQIVAPWVLQDLGNLLLAFIMLWAYLSFSQFLLIWVENLQHEIPWYIHRLTGGWAVIGAALIALQFALPFVLLLSRTIKRSPAMLGAVAAVVAAMHLIELFWFVAPTFHPEGFSLHWTTVLAPIGIGGVWFWGFLSAVRGRSLLPIRDPRFIAILEEHGLAGHG
jgi:hypothetical protein